MKIEPAYSLRKVLCQKLGFDEAAKIRLIHYHEMPSGYLRVWDLEAEILHSLTWQYGIQPDYRLVERAEDFVYHVSEPKPLPDGWKEILQADGPALREMSSWKNDTHGVWLAEKEYRQTIGLSLDGDRHIREIEMGRRT